MKFFRQHKASILSLFFILLACAGIFLYRTCSTDAAVYRLIDQADRIVIVKHVYHLVIDEPGSPVPPPPKDIILFESRERKDLDALKSSLDTSTFSLFRMSRCFCSGAPWIRLYQGDKLIGTISNHHGNSIRCEELWGGFNVQLTDTKTWKNWFAERNMDLTQMR